MKILHITPILIARGGFSRGHLDLAKELNKHDFESVFAIPEERGTALVMEKNDFKYYPINVKFIPGYFSISFEKSVKINLKDIINKEKPDVILFEPSVAKIVMSVIKNNDFNIKTLMWDKSPPTDRTIIGRLHWHRWTRIWKNLPDGINLIMCQSEPHVNFVKGMTKKYSSNFIVMENGVDVNQFIHKNGIIKNPKKIVYCGTISKVRGVMSLIKSGEILENMNIDFEIHFLGRGSELKKLKSIEHKYQWLNIHGFLDEEQFQKHLSEAAIGVVPHPYFKCWELCSSLKLREYAAISSVVVARDLEVHRSFKDQEWMYLSKREGDDNLSLAIAIKAALQDKLILNKGKIARSFAEENFTYERQTFELVNWLTRI